MTQYNTLNVKLSNWKFNKLKSGTKNGTEVTLKIFSNVFGDSDDENIFLQKLCKVPANNSSANAESSKTQLHTTGESWGFVGRVLGPLLKTELPLIGHVLKPLPKCALIPLGAATDVAIHKKLFGSGVTH